MDPIVILDDMSMRQRVLRNNQIIAEFSFLGPARQAMDAVSGCVSCQKAAKGRVERQAIQEAKRMIAQLSADRKERLRQLIGAQKVRVYYLDAANNRVRVDF